MAAKTAKKNKVEVIEYEPGVLRVRDHRMLLWPDQTPRGKAGYMVADNDPFIERYMHNLEPALKGAKVVPLEAVNRRDPNAAHGDEWKGAAPKRWMSQYLAEQGKLELPTPAADKGQAIMEGSGETGNVPDLDETPDGDQAEG